MVASVIGTHVHSRASGELIRTHLSAGVACSAHSVAECYNTLTTYKLPRRIRALEAFQIIERWQELFTVIEMSAGEYVDMLKDASERNVTGATIYDALHVACARKAGADLIYTWNIRHFKTAAPDWAQVILEP